MEDLKFYQDKMDKTMEVLLADYGTIRAGRANPHVLDKIKVDYYGTPTPIQQVGNISSSAGRKRICSGSTYDRDPAMGKEPVKSNRKSDPYI